MSSTNRLKKLHAKCLNFDTMEFPPYIECDMSKKGNPINSVNVSEMTLTKLHLKYRMKTNDRFYYNADTGRYYEIPNGDRHYFDVTDDFDWDTVIKTNTIQYKDIEVVVDKQSFFYLLGSQLNYSGGLNGKGFEWSNPNANRTCGCGESFSL